MSGYIVPPYPHPLLAPEKCDSWGDLRAAYDRAAAEIAASDADVIVVFSTRWHSILGHQIQADPTPTWTLVDEEFHELGSIEYALRMDPAAASAVSEAANSRGLHCRTVAYHGFPVDTGTVVALKLLNPDNRIPAVVVSCNVYSDRAETIVLGKATRDGIAALGRKPVFVAVTALSNRMFHYPIEPSDDRIHSPKDDEWNRKMLEFLGEGRLEDVSQLARSFSHQANGDSKLKAIWWLAASMGQTNAYDGEVYAYGPIHGTGAAVVRLTPSEKSTSNLEFDEEDVETYAGDRNVLAAAAEEG